MTPTSILDHAMKTARKPNVCPASERMDLVCIKGRIMQFPSEDGPLLFWGMCQVCLKANGGKK